METHNIDSKIRKAIEESADFYDAEAGKSKERIWQHIQRKKQGRHRLNMLRSLAAACILLFITLFILTISYSKADRKLKTLVELNRILQNQTVANKESTTTQKGLLPVTQIALPDTVYIEKIVPVYKPVIKAIQIVDTVYIERKVFVEKEQPQKLVATTDSYPAETPPQLTINNFETQLIIRNNETIKHKKERKLQIRFGGNKNQSNEGILALTTEL